MTEIQQRNKWTLINTRKSKNKQASGEILFEFIQVEKAHSFLDFIQGGVEINLMIGIDFTGYKIYIKNFFAPKNSHRMLSSSNGDPDKPHSLHYPGAGPTQYAKAITAVGNILAYYDVSAFYKLNLFVIFFRMEFRKTTTFPCMVLEQSFRQDKFPIASLSLLTSNKFVKIFFSFKYC